MRILMKSGTTEQVLCHGHVDGVDRHVGPSNLRTAGPIEVQVAEFLRGANVAAYNRGNLKSSLSFSVHRECASAQAAEKFCLTHPRDCLRSDTCVILAENATGGTEKLTMSSAAVTDVQCEQIGVGVIVSYQIIGGAIA